MSNCRFIQLWRHLFSGDVNWKRTPWRYGVILADSSSCIQLICPTNMLEDAYILKTANFTILTWNISWPASRIGLKFWHSIQVTDSHTSSLIKTGWKVWKDVCTDGQTFGSILPGRHTSDDLTMQLWKLQWCINMYTTIDNLPSFLTSVSHYSQWSSEAHKESSEDSCSNIFTDQLPTVMPKHWVSEHWQQTQQ